MAFRVALLTTLEDRPASMLPPIIKPENGPPEIRFEGSLSLPSRSLLLLLSLPASLSLDSLGSLSLFLRDLISSATNSGLAGMPGINPPGLYIGGVPLLNGLPLYMGDCGEEGAPPGDVGGGG